MDRRTVLTGLTLASTFAMPAIARAQAPTVHKMTIVAGHPAIFLWVKHLKESFITTIDAELAKTGQHRIDWNEAFGGSLAKIGGEIDAVSTGIADIGYNPSLFNPAKLPMQNVSFNAPFASSNPRVVTEVVEALQTSVPEMGRAWQRYNQTYLGGGISIDSYQLLTKFPVRTVDDLKGRKIGAPGSVVSWLNGTGAVAVAGDLTTYYNAISTGVYEGVVIFATAAAPARLAEVAPFVTRVDLGSAYAGGLTVNTRRWGRLPKPVQDAIGVGVGAYAKGFYAEQEARIAGAYNALKTQNGTITELPIAERQKWAAGMSNVAGLWAETLDKAGLPGRQILTGYMDGLRQRGETPLRNWSAG